MENPDAIIVIHLTKKVGEPTCGINKVVEEIIIPVEEISNKCNYDYQIIKSISI